ncbi:MAG: histidine kinase [Flavobacteriales bacterium]|nr:histidine kinase [Flavobacteriales bacterium]
MRSIRFDISLVLCLFALLAFPSLAQSPAHFFIGEKELENVEVYSLLETKEGKLYASTNTGVYVYRSGHFEPIASNQQAANRSLFGLVENSDGSIFCHNLGGQIFKIKDAFITLYCTVPEEYITNRIQLFCQDGDLFYFSKGSCLRITDENTFTRVVDTASNDVLGWELSRLIDGRVLISNRQRTGYLEIENGVGQLKEYRNSSGDSAYVMSRSFFYLNDELAILEPYGIYTANGDSKKSLSNDYKNRMFPASKNEVWGLKTSSGLNIFTSKNGEIQVSETYFENYFISAFSASSTGTIYLGTFGSGIIVIPNANMIDHPFGDRLKKIRDFSVTKDNRVFYSQMGNGIMLYDGKTRTIQNEQTHFYNSIFWNEGFDFKTNDEFKGLTYDNYNPTPKEVTLPTLNDVFVVDRNTILLATSKGLFRMGANTFMPQLKWLNFENADHVFNLQESRSRTQAITADTLQKIIYFSDFNGTFSIGKDGVKRELLFKNEKIRCEDILFYDQYLWCATLDNGVLVFDDGKMIKQYTFSSTSNTDRIRQLAIRDNMLYVLSENMVKCMNLISGDIHRIGIAEGAIGGVNKFDLSDDRMWLLIENANILSLDLQQLTQKKNEIHVYLDSIVVADKTIKQSGNHRFSYNQNDFIFYVDHRNPALGEAVRIQYRIKGFENEWNTKAAGTGMIEYKYLPPGNYTFEVFADYYGARSEVKSFAFEIKQPYWLTSWFIIMVGISIIFIFTLILRYRIKILKRREREEMIKKELKSNFVEAELRALRSQMNPHFIFNSLHSIQSLILNSEIESSYDYLVLFSKLVRNVLTYSNEEFIPITSELEFLEVYLKLEKLRFEDDFNFTIELEGEDDVLVPSLIVQPFVENALLHGLHHKTEDKMLSVKFIVEYDHVKCIVEDNGIGRKAAQEIKERQGGGHESFAIKAIRKRLNMYKSQMSGNPGFTITDLVDSDGACGTRVEIILPQKSIF